MYFSKQIKAKRTSASFDIYSCCDNYLSMPQMTL